MTQSTISQPDRGMWILPRRVPNIRRKFLRSAAICQGERPADGEDWSFGARVDGADCRGDRARSELRLTDSGG